MQNFLTFTYDKPNERAAPLWQPGMPRDTPVSIWWKPSILCSAEQCLRNQSLGAPPGIPWHDINIAEIWVESRKAYEILNRITPPGQKFFVRILGQFAMIASPWAINQEVADSKIRDIVIFTHGDKKETELAMALGIDAVIASTSDVDVKLIYETEIAVFCHLEDSSADHLFMAIGAGCSIVSSDAGAAEEYLAKYAKPGSWHVARTWNAREWRVMLLDLQGEPNEVFQSSIVDQTPYMPAWKE